jgi:DNA-directed RNA polymerase specialized sigma24 family protein
VVITDNELRLASQGAGSAYRSGRGLVEYNDLVGEAHLWIVENFEKVAQWRDEGRHGQNKLRNACRQRCLTVISRERKRRSGLQPGDVFYYTPQIIREIIPNIWNEDDWASGETVTTGEVRSPSRPSEGNNRLAMIADIRAAFFNLKKPDQELLYMLHRDSFTFEQAAERFEVTERTIRRREERVFDKMVERLGGEPPWKHR